MSNITVRNISEEVIDKVKIMARIDRRSLNSELLVVIEKGLDEETRTYAEKTAGISPNIQLSVWQELCGLWEDERPTGEIIEEILASRTMGREIGL